MLQLRLVMKLFQELGLIAISHCIAKMRLLHGIVWVAVPRDLRHSAAAPALLWDVFVDFDVKRCDSK